MSSITLDERATTPNAPANGKQVISVDQNNGLSTRKSAGSVETLKSIFGANFASKRKDALETTSSNSAPGRVYDTLSISNAPLGNYMVFYKFTWRGGDSGKNLIFELRDNASTLSNTYMEIEPKDTGSDIRTPQMGFTILNLNGNHDIDLVYRPESDGKTCYLYSWEIAVFRID